jgi:hypothetical protein
MGEDGGLTYWHAGLALGSLRISLLSGYSSIVHDRQRSAHIVSENPCEYIMHDQIGKRDNVRSPSASGLTQNPFAALSIENPPHVLV